MFTSRSILIRVLCSWVPFLIIIEFVYAIHARLIYKKFFLSIYLYPKRNNYFNFNYFCYHLLILAQLDLWSLFFRSICINDSCCHCLDFHRFFLPHICSPVISCGICSSAFLQLNTSFMSSPHHLLDLLKVLAVVYIYLYPDN